MSDIVDDAKEWLERRDNQTLRTHSEHCHHVHAECLVDRLVAEVERHRMTEEERKAADAASLRALKACADEVWQPLLRYLDRTAPREEGDG